MVDFSLDDLKGIADNVPCKYSIEELTDNISFENGIEYELKLANIIKEKIKEHYNIDDNGLLKLVATQKFLYG